ncbi:hypothetical protein [Aquimarina sp. RZ0]|uniref:hypothetical protein n=1 Tax=Aquimarina sp. RZ0 TaxID=2607730 RepID=UPI0011F0CE45|nr:hypothetical protein [Aquimarina sp. RZ0]KAA1243412.1 hypothetical protein F0000_21105 [Aquimarina sp. RZ0]
MEEDEKTPRKTWDLMIGLALVLFGSFRLYNYMREDQDFNFRILFTGIFIIYGFFLIYKYSQNTDKE